MFEQGAKAALSVAERCCVCVGLCVFAPVCVWVICRLREGKAGLVCLCVTCVCATCVWAMCVCVCACVCVCVFCVSRGGGRVIMSVCEMCVCDVCVCVTCVCVRETSL